MRVTGGGSDVTARVEVIVKFRPPAQGAPITFPDQMVGAYGQDVALPAGAMKEFTVWVPTTASQTNTADVQPGTVRLVANGQRLAQQDIEFRTGRTPQWPLVGVLAEAPVVQRAVGGVAVQYQGLPVPVSIAALSPTDVPTFGERLRAFKAIVVQGSAPAMMTAEQRLAVREWVAGGGNLLLMGGPDASRAVAALPPDSLALGLGGANSAANLAPLAAWLGNQSDPVGTGPAARLEPRGGLVLVGTRSDSAAEGEPLVWRAGLGEGTVTLLSVDPALEPIASWPGTPALMQKLLEPALASFSGDGPSYAPYQQDVATRLQMAVDALPPEAYPSLTAVALILGLFALLVGPVAHILLRRLDRRGWIWLVVPGASMLLVVALYVVGIGREGRDVFENVVARVRITPEDGTARAAVVAGFFAPTREGLTVTAAGNEPVRVNRSGSYGYGGPYGYP
jgi:hypothetical protein